MKTAKELRDNLLMHIQNKKPGFAAMRLKQYEEQLCKEQRMKCAEAKRIEDNESYLRKSILHAPKPDGI